jgi:PAS domain S-box-containing protein
MLSPEGIVVSWNGGAERIKGYTAEEIVGRHFSVFYPDDDVASGKPEMELEVAIAEGRYEDEGWRLRKDGSRFWANVILAPVRDDRGRLLGFAKVTRDMSERRRAREELQRSEQLNRDLRGESLAKDEFLGVISHELRTPLTVLYGGTKLLAQRYAQLAEDDRCELIESLAEEADRIKSLIESVFLLVNPSPNLDLRPVSLSAAVETAAKDFRRVAPARELRLHLPQRDSAVAVEGPLFQRVLLNLLGNADKYSPALRPIELAASTTPEGAVIEVQDRGPGVDPTELGLIFGSFYRSASTAEAVPGKGIGLAVCRRLITLFGGSIEARARKGGGLNIRITLPDIAGFAPEAT